MIGHFKMGQCNNRFNPIFQQLVKDIVIKLKTFFIRFQLISIWKNT